ncbi:hypothetical protein QTQ03_30020 [Micromonospora sp. WMMA1363]|nr:hypothetical protein [Micromonospora sp. WMMA1363]MDM4723443.1 hypothetical protein [Micromonospora sp. WMMA1363]MDM4723599.1 hypothetical protein [Micromonospora sp. WMMA1363]
MALHVMRLRRITQLMERSHALSGAVAWLGGCALAAGLGARPAVGTVVVGAAVTTVHYRQTSITPGRSSPGRWVR